MPWTRYGSAIARISAAILLAALYFVAASYAFDLIAGAFAAIRSRGRIPVTLLIHATDAWATIATCFDPTDFRWQLAALAPLLPTLAITLAIRRYRRPPPPSIHGNMQWATPREQNENGIKPLRRS